MYQTNLLDGEVQKAASANLAVIEETTSLHNDYKEVFGSPAARRVLETWAVMAAEFSPKFTGNSRTYYHEGAHDFWRGIMDVLAVAVPEAYLSVYEAYSLQLRALYQQGVRDVHAQAKGRES